MANEEQPANHPSRPLGTLPKYDIEMLYAH